MNHKNIVLGLQDIPDINLRETLQLTGMCIADMEITMRYLIRGKRISSTPIHNPIGFRKWLSKGGNTKYTPAQRVWIRQTEQAYRRFLDARDEIKLIASELGRIDFCPEPKVIYRKPLPESEILNPFKPIPNAKRFTIGLEKGVDLLLLNHGLLKKVRFEPEIEPYRNDSMNRYVKYQVGRLHACREDPALFWRIVISLMLRSTSFMVCAFNNKYPQWQRKMRWSVVLSTIQDYIQIVKERRSDLEFYRFYVPKANGKFRPIGAPTRSWKLFLHMLNNFLVIFVSPHQPRNQHGFWPGRGTLTAYRTILSEVISSRDIVEFDLQSFFEKVKLAGIGLRLSELKVPEEIIKWITKINLHGPKLPPETKVDETLARVKNISTAKSLLSYPGAERQIGKRRWSSSLDYGGGLSRWVGYYRLQRHGWATGLSEEEFRALGAGMDGEGVPQGAPTSPLLATLCLHNTLFSPNNPFKTVMYADDGLIHGDNISVSDLMEKKDWATDGIHIHPEKTLQIKKDGIWLRPLKFLGLEFDGKLEKFYASTRTGATLEFDKHDLVEAIKHREQGTLSDEEEKTALDNWENAKIVNKAMASPKGSTWTSPSLSGSWVELAKSSIFGLIQARMYGDAWNERTLLQDFNYTYEEGSWAASYKGMVKADIRNSSSLACYHLASKLHPTWKAKVKFKETVVGQPTG